ncbi:DNA topoisomerase [Anaerovoracaceae bacterium 42-11]
MILFFDNIDAAVSVAAVYGGLVYQGRPVRPDELDECREKVKGAYRLTGGIKCVINDISSLIIWAEGDMVTLAPANSYGEEYLLKKNSQVPFYPDVLHYEPAAGKEDKLESLMKAFKSPGYHRIYFVSTGPVSDRVFVNLYCYCKTPKPFARISPVSLTREGITEALKSVNEEKSQCWLFSEMTRNMLYFMSRINLSQFASKAFHQQMDLRIKQLPALSLLVRRETEIRKIRPAKDYVLQLRLTTENGEKFFAEPAGRSIGRYGSENAARSQIEKISGGAVIDKLVKEKKETWPEGPLDLQNALRQAEKEYGYPEKKSMDVLNWLHLNGYISRPNTLGRTYPSSQESQVYEAIRMLRGTKLFSALLEKYKLQKITYRLFSDEPPGIMITGKSPEGMHHESALNLYKLIAMQMIKSCLPPEETEVTKVVILYGGMLFSASSTHVIKQGYKVLEPKKVERKQLPANLTEGMELSVEPYIKTAAAAPKQQYTKAQFLSELTHKDKKLKVGFANPYEAKNLLAALLSKEYVIEKGQKIVATQKGILFIHTLAGMDSLLDMGAVLNWEMHLQAICNDGSSKRAAAHAAAVLKNAQDIITKWCHMLSDAAGKVSPVPCPVCAERMYATSEAFFCRRCGYHLPAILFGRKMEPQVMGYLCTRKRTPMLYGFTLGSRNLWGKLLMNEDFEVTLSTDSDYTCPLCGKALKISDDGKLIHCTSGCSFKIPSVVYGHKLSRRELLLLFSDRRMTPLITDFRLSDGEFSGYLQIAEDGLLTCTAVTK